MCLFFGEDPVCLSTQSGEFFGILDNFLQNFVKARFECQGKTS